MGVQRHDVDTILHVFPVDQRLFAAELFSPQ